MGVLENNTLYKEKRKLEEKQSKLEQKRRKYYEPIRYNQKKKVDEDINKKIVKKIRKDEIRIECKLKDIKRKEKGKVIKIKGITIGKLHKIVRDIFSFSVRLDSAYKTTGGIRTCKCCTCSTEKSTFGQIQCGHYISRTNKFLLYDRYNVAGQCWMPCNNKQMGNGEPTKFRIYLYDRYGPERLEYLDQKNDLKNYKHTREELDQIIQESVEIIKKYIPMIELNKLPKIRKDYLTLIIENQPLY